MKTMFLTSRQSGGVFHSLGLWGTNVCIYTLLSVLTRLTCCCVLWRLPTYFPEVRLKMKHGLWNRLLNTSWFSRSHQWSSNGTAMTSTVPTAKKLLNWPSERLYFQSFFIFHPKPSWPLRSQLMRGSAGKPGTEASVSFLLRHCWSIHFTLSKKQTKNKTYLSSGSHLAYQKQKEGNILWTLV